MPAVDRAGSLGLLLAAAALAAATAACMTPSARRAPAEEAVLERRRQGLEALIAAAERGPLIPFDQVLVVVDQALVQDLLSAAVPFERVVAGRYRIRITDASVVFDDGFALVRLDGSAGLASPVGEAVSAEVSAFGGLDIVELDPASGVLRGRVRMIAFEARRVGVLGLGAPAERLVEDLGRETLETWSPLASTIEIPVRFEREVTIPAVGPQGGVEIPAAAVPLRAGVRDLKAFRGKLWVSIDASTGDSARPPAAPTPADDASPTVKP